jgi:hypothetical protein
MLEVTVRPQIYLQLIRFFYNAGGCLKRDTFFLYYITKSNSLGYPCNAQIVKLLQH